MNAGRNEIIFFGKVEESLFLEITVIVVAVAQKDDVVSGGPKRAILAIAAMQDVRELNIGHAIVARAVFTGLGEAVAGMKRIMLEARS